MYLLSTIPLCVSFKINRYAKFTHHRFYLHIYKGLLNEIVYKNRILLIHILSILHIELNIGFVLFPLTFAVCLPIRVIFRHFIRVNMRLVGKFYECLHFELFSTCVSLSISNIYISVAS